jgi:hypothetical protein
LRLCFSFALRLVYILRVIFRFRLPIVVSAVFLHIVASRDHSREPATVLSQRGGSGGPVVTSSRNPSCPTCWPVHRRRWPSNFFSPSRARHWSTRWVAQISSPSTVRHRSTAVHSFYVQASSPTHGLSEVRLCLQTPPDRVHLAAPSLPNKEKADCFLSAAVIPPLPPHQPFLSQPASLLNHTAVSLPRSVEAS